MENKNIIKVGILINSNYIPVWAYKMLDLLKKNENIDICLIVRNKPKRTYNESTYLNKFLRIFRKDLLFILYNKIDTYLFGKKGNVFQEKDISELIKCYEIIVTPKETQFSDYIENQDIQKIKNYNIDLFIRLGFRILRGDILKAAKFGIWSYHHGDNSTNRGGPAGVWEVIERRDETGVVLQILNENLDGGLVLEKGLFATKKMSFSKNRNNFYKQAIGILPREIEKLQILGPEKYFNKIDEKNKNIEFYSNRLYKVPENLTILKFIFRNLFDITKHKVLSKLYRNQWGIIYTLSDNQKLSKSFYRFKNLIPPKNRFWADPFPLVKDGRNYIFFEELYYNTNKGHISCVEVDKKGMVGEPQIVLSKEYHLSYPFIFEDQGGLFMIPESASNKTVDLYECIKFPDKWKYKRTLINNKKIVDATIIKYMSIYWMFCNEQINEFESTHNQLCIYYSEYLNSSNWEPHLLNPIKTDVSAARPAGNFIQANGKIYRPVQNSAKHYGHNLEIFEVLTLSETEYKEKHIQKIIPNWNKKICSLHTINHTGNITVSDIQVRKFKF